MREDNLVSTNLFTIGYERRTPDELIDKLRKANIRRLVDIRELPLSRKRGFSKTALGNALTEVDIEYVHIRALGNPKPIREMYWKGMIEQGAQLYRRHIRNGSRAAMVKLSKSLGNRRTCLMCVERESDVCHRAVLIDELEALVENLRVTHL